MKNNVVLDFSKMTCNLNSANVQTQRRLNLDPNTETIVWIVCIAQELNQIKFLT
jgi:hypothetical protein